MLLHVRVDTLTVIVTLVKDVELETWGFCATSFVCKVYINMNLIETAGPGVAADNHQVYTVN